MIITFSNFRGGSGKTTSVINIGACLHRKGYKVLLVDFDSQENLTSAVTTKPNGIDVINLLQDQTVQPEYIHHEEEYDIIAGNPALGTIEPFLPQQNRELRLKQALDTIRDKYDFILIDTSPALSFATVSTLIAGDAIIIPAQADPFSIKGISKLTDSIKSISERYNSQLRILGVLITRYNQRTVIRLRLADLLQNAVQSLHIKVCSPIRECTALLEAITLHKNIFDYAPKSNGAKDYEIVTDEILETINTNLKEVNHG